MLVEYYQVVVVGTDDKVDKQLPNNILSIHRTQNQKELAEIYSVANVFVNPTREEVLGMVNIESLACGTPVVMFQTGGSPECVDEKSGIVIEKNKTEAMFKTIIQICEQKLFDEKDCVTRAKKFDESKKYHEYIELYLSSVER